MMEFSSRYVSKEPNQFGIVEYTSEENEVWRQLFTRLQQLQPNRACDEYLQGLQILNLNHSAIPQLNDVSNALTNATGWRVAKVAALIPAREFFELLATRHFPAATFIRAPEEIEYVTEPDIFHELFGHCPLLTEPVYANFVHEYAKLVLTRDEQDWPLLQRFFWFTVEFGLIKTAQGNRAYGGGILSSPNETVYCVESDIPRRLAFDPLTIMRTPYRIDELQKTYFVIDSYQQLYDFLKLDITALLAETRKLGEFEPLFQVEEGNPCIHIGAC